MSTMGNIIRVHRPARRARLLSPCPLRLRPGVANAADPGSSGLGADETVVGESVTVLRSECTGHRPVHFFGRIAGVAAALVVAAVPTSAFAEAPSPAGVARPAV